MQDYVMLLTHKNSLYQLSITSKLLNKLPFLYICFCDIYKMGEIHDELHSYRENADGNPYFMLIFHFLWHKAVSEFEKTTCRGNIRVKENEMWGWGV